MSAEALLRDPGFQLNLLLWMTREQPANTYLVRPLLQDLGFALVYIENPFPLPEETVRSVNASVLDVSVTPEPDVLLRRDSDKKALYVEAKATSFSAASSSARQARGHLLAVGPAFAEVMKPLEQCLLCYLVQDADRPQQDLNRQALQNQVYAALLCELNLTSPDGGYTRTIDELLVKTTDGVFQYIGRERQLRMRRLIRENLFKRISTFWKDKEPNLARLENDTLKVQFRDARQREDFLDWMEDYKRTGFSAATPLPEEALPGWKFP